jgi:hypothetical protein
MLHTGACGGLLRQSLHAQIMDALSPAAFHPLVISSPGPVITSKVNSTNTCEVPCHTINTLLFQHHSLLWGLSLGELQGRRRNHTDHETPLFTN